MKKFFLRFPAILCTLMLVWGFVPHAQAGDQNVCMARITSDMTSIHDEWRSRLFGSRRGTDGKIISLTGGETDKVRIGIFETKNRLTSELIEPILESYRVYRCQTLQVCQTAVQSFQTKGGSVDMRILGCAPRTLERYQECYFAGTPEAADGNAASFSDATRTAQQCDQLVQETLAAERAVLKLAVAYDSGYRSLLQLSGMVDWMLQGFPTETVKAISDMVNMLGKLHQIPCFIGQCDNPKTEYLTQ